VCVRVCVCVEGLGLRFPLSPETQTMQRKQSLSAYPPSLWERSFMERHSTNDKRVIKGLIQVEVTDCNGISRVVLINQSTITFKMLHF